MPLPDFLIIGTPRAATTSLHHYLSQHPSIAMSAVKEPNFFLFDHTGAPLIGEESIIRRSVSDPGRYGRLFRKRPGTLVAGEASPLYLYVRETPASIARQIPSAKLIAVLRHPVDRAYSHFLFVDQGTPKDAAERFARTVRSEMEAGDSYEPYRTGTHFLRCGLYAQQIARYLDAFGRSQMRFFRYEDVRDRPDAVLREICGFLGVDPGLGFDTTVAYNTSGLARGRIEAGVRRLLAKGQPYARSILPARLAGALGRTRAQHASSGVVKPRERFDARTRAALLSYYDADISRVESLLDWDLSAWRDVARTVDRRS